MKFLKIAALLPLLAFSSSVFAQDAKAPAIPDVFKEDFRAGLYKEEFIARTLSAIRTNAQDHLALRKAEVEAIQKNQGGSMRMMQVVQILQMDANNDGKVTKDEVKQTLSSRMGAGLPPEAINRQIDEIMRKDRNKDGTIDFEEMRQVDEPAAAAMQNPANNRLLALLALDPNKDGTLTIDELTKIAEAAFAAVDTDHNGIISTEESSKIVRAMPVMPATPPVAPSAPVAAPSSVVKQ